MKCGYTPKWVHPKKMITHFSDVLYHQKARIQLLWFIASLTYGLTFLCYEKPIQPVAEHRNTRRKLHAVITLIKDVLMETWISEVLLTSLEDC